MASSEFRLRSPCPPRAHVELRIFADAVIEVPDDGGADDYPGQKDLSFFTCDFAGLPNTLAIGWGWDDTAWSGNNTGDACALIDVDLSATPGLPPLDGKANFAFASRSRARRPRFSPNGFTLTVYKNVTNDNGGALGPEAFTVHVKANGSDVPGSPAAGSSSPGTTYTLAPGVTYVVSEGTLPSG
jgi:hypothetical protein